MTEAWLRAMRVVRKMGVGQRGVEVVIWGGVVEAIRNDVRERLPLTWWREIAAACGVSDDTLARKRAAVGDMARTWFADAEAAREWYAGLVAREGEVEARAATPVAPRGRGRPAQPAVGAARKAAVRPEAKRAVAPVVAGTVDWNKVARGG